MSLWLMCQVMWHMKWHLTWNKYNMNAYLAVHVVANMASDMVDMRVTMEGDVAC
jgi:hypothetical protein